jgi:hypothetical protein
MEPNVDIKFQVDLGEIIPGQHVVTRGIEIADRSYEGRGSALYYSFVPGFRHNDTAVETGWSLGTVEDDLGTIYNHQCQGRWGPDADGVVRRGDGFLGNIIPSVASILRVSICPVWTPPEEWVKNFEVNVVDGTVININKVVGP